MQKPFFPLEMEMIYHICAKSKKDQTEVSHVTVRTEIVIHILDAESSAIQTFLATSSQDGNKPDISNYTSK